MIIHVTYAYVDSYSSVVNHYFPDTEGKFLILFRILSLCAYITILARPCVLGNTLVVNHYFPDTEARPCVLDHIYRLWAPPKYKSVTELQEWSGEDNQL